MVINPGDVVKVIQICGADGFTDVKLGTVATVAAVHSEAKYPYELEGYDECLMECELELVRRGDGK